MDLITLNQLWEGNLFKDYEPTYDHEISAKGSVSNKYNQKFTFVFLPLK